MDAGGKCLDKRYLDCRKPDEIWSTLIFPQEKPPNKHLKLWRQVFYAIAPRGRIQDRIGRFTTKGHKIWEWRYDKESNKVYHLKGMVMDVYGLSLVRNYANRPNCWTRSRINIPLNDHGEICSMKDVALAVKSIISHSPRPPTQATQSTFWEVIRGWGNTWMWDSLAIAGDLDWIAASIADNSCVAITDGSYMKELYSYLNSAAFVLEYAKGRGRLMGSFVEKTPNAGSYRGELLGLMAIHLILQSLNEVFTDLWGPIHIYSDCLGALNKVENLPPYRIPTKCSHSDILKNIMVNCSNLTFLRTFPM